MVIKKSNFRFKKVYILYLGILIGFIGISLFMGYHHEPWADEAHAWLIARDTSFYTLFFKYLRTEGHPALWYLVLKLFQFCGLKYEYFFVIPVIFSSIGVFVFLFKSKFPRYIKVLFPFTFFVFYQYTIVARGYCLLFPILCCLASLWKKRIKKCYLFTLFLVLLINTEVYTALLAGFIYLYYIYDYIRLRKEKKDSKRLLGCLIFLTVSFLVTFISIFPTSTNSFYAVSLPYFLCDSFFTSFKAPIILKIILSILILCSFCIFYLKERKPKEYFQALFFILPVFGFYLFGYLNLWHLGIMLLIFIFCFWIQGVATKKFISCFLVIVCAIQIYWSVSSSIFDYKYNYSASKDVAEFIKGYDYENLDIYGIEFWVSSVNAYFDKNIFDNWDTEIGFFYWDIKNKFYSTPINEYIMINNKIDIVIENNFTKSLNQSLLERYYNIYEFPGYIYVEDFIYEDQTFIVYVLKEIDNDV